MPWITADGDEVRDALKLSDVDCIQLQSRMDAIVQAEMQHIERIIRGAIMAGYDGVDIHRDRSLTSVGITDFEAWHRPAPDSDSGYQTERYTWDWFSDDELARVLTDDEFTNIEDFLPAEP